MKETGEDSDNVDVVGKCGRGRGRPRKVSVVQNEEEDARTGQEYVASV